MALFSKEIAVPAPRHRDGSGLLGRSPDPSRCHHVPCTVALLRTANGFNLKRMQMMIFDLHRPHPGGTPQHTHTT